jgi:hypothetical protein
MRIHRGRAGALLVFAAVVGTLTLPLPAASADGPTFSASPTQNVADGSLIRVSGTGWAPDSAIGIAECPKDFFDISSCDESTLVVLPTDNVGNFGPTHVVASRWLSIGGVPLDCASAACFLVTSSDPAFSEFVSHRLTFDPSAPPPPPLSITVSVDVKATVNPRGVVLVTGTVDCSRPALVDLSGQLSQIWKRFIFRSFFDVPIVCRGLGTAWRVKVFPDTGLFAAGGATLQYFASAVAGAATASVSGSQHMRLVAVAHLPTSPTPAANPWSALKG